MNRHKWPDPITPYWARAAVQDVSGIGNDDPEASHQLEDELHVAVLRAIADGCEDPAALAAIALETRDVKFSRRYS